MAIDQNAIKEHIRGILVALGDNPDREGLKDTPDRVARMYEEVFEGMNYSNEEIAKMFDKTFEDEMDFTTDSKDMVVVKETDIEKLTEGDIITFRSQASGNTITHRINHINEKNEIITKGDANNSIDPGVVKEEQIVGKVTLSIPRIGYIFQFVQNNLKIILIVVVMIVVTASIVNKIKKYNTKLL